MTNLFGRTALLGLLAVLALPAAAAAQQSQDRVVYASVLDKNGDPVPDLTVKDFIVREDGQAREILRVTPDNDPLQIALLVDNSDYMRQHVSDLRRALAAFIDNTRKDIPIALITLAERPTVVVPYTTDRAQLRKRADSVFAVATAGNYLLDGIAEASKGILARPTWRSAIAVITTPEDLSYRKYSEVLRDFREGGASLHVLTLGASLGNADREIVVGRATEETGGRSDVVLSAMGLAPKAAQLARELSNQYRIVYARPERLIPPKTTEVEVKRPDLDVRSMPLKTESER